MYGLVVHLRAVFCVIFTLAGICFCSVSHALVISQIYGGGGNAGSIYTNDFIELFNNSPATANLDGISVQYASATGTTWHKTDLSGTLAAYHYYLIQEAAGSGGTTALPTPDAVDSIGLAASSGKIALVNSLILLPFSNACLSPSILDLVGYGTANCYEGSAAAFSPSNTTSVARLSGGLMDRDDNFIDFELLLSPNPRNAVSPANVPVSAAPTPDINSVDEPASVLLLNGGLAALWLLRRRRHLMLCSG